MNEIGRAWYLVATIIIVYAFGGAVDAGPWVLLGSIGVAMIAVNYYINIIIREDFQNK